jgi:alkylhydroperoxidase/carboxymuconolactone decarboxylase family protein YurZ
VITDLSISTGVSLSDLRKVALEMLDGVHDGAPLPQDWAALVAVGTAAAVTSLDRVALETAIDRALAAGATLAQVQETISLVSGLGVHSLMVSFTSLAERARAAGVIDDAPLDDHRQALWDRHVGDDPFWTGFSMELPGFLDAMLRLSPDQFVAFFDYCAVPWKSGAVRARCKELIALASDATPTHRFLPGFRLHLRNAIALGAGRAEILQALDIAAAAPPHSGTR